MTSTITPFIVLIERRRLENGGLRLLWTLWTLLLVAAFAWAQPARAQTLPSKISADLQAAMTAIGRPAVITFELASKT